jgi:hypothetical protein
MNNNSPKEREGGKEDGSMALAHGMAPHEKKSIVICSGLFVYPIGW